MNKTIKEKILALHYLNVYNNKFKLQDICHTADCDYKIFNQLEQNYLEAYSNYLDAQKSKSYTLIISSKNKLLEVSNNLKKESMRLLGINLLNNHKQDVIYQILSIKFGEMKIVKSLYYKEVLQLTKTVERNSSLNKNFVQCLKEKGIDVSLYTKWLEALEINDAHAYKSAQEDISEAFVTHFNELTQSTHNNLLEAVQSAIPMDYLFGNCHSSFDTDKIFILPDLYIIKVCFSQALVRAYGTV
ncbi:hypothetical protein [Vibrio sp. 1CM23M]|uniref:hypothetical protein n=1 Tax=Vibrio sp. 1CM23M TaxID=2929164 RepID=UPI0020C05924|nr:hypothetical protein [Vibrio sp. 1CM23M]MCK8072441.1 hypothetical protein [Vibrio sp. 1CM23M]